ncbi:MAG TPA: PPOX class F420-dependent oxidoreductase, partial [Blastocatellia bacterium]|jgi:pyridoxamine 5'-phosphate oxidase family protein|nr:PPOX class F420-dependent oxidoreductase [Blastocatellia bacterium]
MFSDKEGEYLKSQRLGRIATVSKSGQPDVAPVGYRFDGEYFYVGGIDMTKTLKYKNVLSNPKVSFVVDDLDAADPWQPRGVKIHGTAEVTTGEGHVGSGIYIRIKPEVKWSWGIEDAAIKDGKPNIHKARF